MSGMSITQYFFPGQVKNSASGRKEIYGHRNKERAKTALDDAYALIRGGVILLRKARTPSLSGLPENSNDIVKGFLITEPRLGLYSCYSYRKACPAKRDPPLVEGSQ